MSKTVSIVLPTLNEKSNISKFIEQVFNQEKNIPGYRFEVIVSDSHSTDGTVDIVKELAKKNKKIHFIEVGKGLGVAQIEGHNYALSKIKPDIMMQLDADGQVEADVILRLIKAIEEGNNLALGSRFIKGGKNGLSLFRQSYTIGSSIVSRILMGPIDIKEFTNSARAFTPELYKKINLKRLPLKEESFISQPAFLHEAVEAGAIYKEVPLNFKNRDAGQSKNRAFNYTYDLVSYALDIKLHKLGINFPLFHFTRRMKTIIKFGMVGFVGTMVDFFFYKIFIIFFGVTPPTSKLFSTSIAIQNNFILNNAWTFRNRKTNNSLIKRLLLFNLVSSGGVIISYLIVYGLHNVFGDEILYIGKFHAAYNNFYFFATIPPVLAWNFTVNHFVTWKRKDD